MSEPVLVVEPAEPEHPGLRSGRERPLGDPFHRRAAAAAAAAVAGLALGAHRTVVLTGGTADGLVRRLVGGLDLGAAALVVLGALVVLTPWVEVALGRRERPTWRRAVTGWLVPLALLWIPTVLISAIALDPAAGPRRLAITLLLGRDPRATAPILGLGIGLLLFLLATLVVLAPVLPRAADALARGADRATGLRRLVVALLVAGVAVRLLLVLVGADGPFGGRSWLPAHLDLVGVGLALAVVRAGVWSLPALDRWRRIAGVLLVLTAWALVTLLLDLPVSPLADDGVDLQVRALLHPVTLAALGAVLIAPATPRGSGVADPTWRRLRPALLAAAATTAPGLVLLQETALVVLARQHRERVLDAALGLRLSAPATPIWLWSTFTAAAFGVLLTLGVLAVSSRLGAEDRAGFGAPAREPGWRPSFALAAAAVTAGGLLVRIVTWLVIAPEKTDGGDPLFYHVTANLIAEGRGFPEPLGWLDGARQIPSALHGPLYPLVLSFSSRFGGITWIDHKFLSILIGTSTVFLVILVARRLGGERAALLAGGLAAIYPNLWLIDSLLFPEGLFAALTTACVLVAYQWRDRPAIWRAAVLGVLIGLAGLTRGEGLLLGVLLAMPWMLRHRDLPLGVRWQHLVVAGAACVATLAPWTIRNVGSFEEFVPLSTNGNELIMYANCEDSYFGRLKGYWSFDCQERHRAEFGEPEGDESQKAVYWREVGLEFAREHADEVPAVLAARVGRQWEVYRPWQNVELSTIEGRHRTSARAGLVMYYGLVAAAVAGAVMLRRNGQRLLPLGAQFLSVTLTALYAYGTVRFRAPVEPVLCILAGVALVPVVPRIRRWLLPPPDDGPSEPAGDRAMARGTDPSAFVIGGRGGLRPGAPAWRRNWLGLGIVSLVLLLPVRGLFRTTGGTMEEGFMLYFPERMWAGDVPNVDFLHLYGPGSLHVLMVWYRVFGFTLEAERAFGMLQHAGIVFGLYALARPWGRRAATAIGVIAAMLVLTPIAAQAMAWNGGLALALWAVVIAVRALHVPAGRDRWWHLAGAGALAGFALTYRPDLVLALVLVGGWMMWRHRWIWKPLLAGAVVGATPMWVHLAVAGPVAAFEGMVIDPVVRLRPGRELPSPPSWDRLDGLLQALAEEEPPWWGLPALPASQGLVLWFWAMILLGIGLVALAVVLHRRTNGSPRSVVLLAGSLFGLGILPQALQRPDSTHLSWVTCISFPLLVLGIAELIALRRPRTHPASRITVGTAAVVALLLVVAPLFTFRYYLLFVRMTTGDVPAAFLVEREGRRFYMGTARSQRASQDVVDLLGATAAPGDRLLVGPLDLARTPYSDTYLYWLLPELEPATYYLEMDPGLADAEDSGLAEDVASADWLILTGFWAGWTEPNTSVERGSEEPNRVRDEQFCLATTFEDGLVELWGRCEDPRVEQIRAARAT